MKLYFNFFQIFKEFLLAVSKPFQDSFRAILEQFRSSFRVISEQFRGSWHFHSFLDFEGVSTGSSEQFQSGF